MCVNVIISFEKVSEEVEEEAIKLGATMIDSVVNQSVYFDSVSRARLFLEALESGALE